MMAGILSLAPDWITWIVYSWRETESKEFELHGAQICPTAHLKHHLWIRDYYVYVTLIRASKSNLWMCTSTLHREDTRVRGSLWP